MKWIVLLSVTCLLGLASAQGMFTGEGYSSTQLAFYSGPNTSAFDSNVQQYWNDYVSGTGNATKAPVETPLTRMALWKDTFSSNFEKSLPLANTTFTVGDQGMSNLTTEELNSMMLTRSTTFNFNTVQGSDYKLSSRSVATSSIPLDVTTSAPKMESPGQILSQGIAMSFNT